MGARGARRRDLRLAQPTRWPGPKWRSRARSGACEAPAPRAPASRRSITISSPRPTSRATTERKAQYLDLARAYDDGALALELADTGTLAVLSTPPGAELSIARYEAHGPKLELRARRALGATPMASQVLDAGSYLLTATLEDREVRYPLVVRRAYAYRLALRVPARGEVPEPMVLVPGGPFLAATDPRAARFAERTLPDLRSAAFR